MRDLARDLAQSSPLASASVRRVIYSNNEGLDVMTVDRKAIERRYMRHALRCAHEVTRYQIATGKSRDSYAVTLARHMRHHVPLMNREVVAVHRAADSVETWLDDMRRRNKARREALRGVHNA